MVHMDLKLWKPMTATIQTHVEVDFTATAWLEAADEIVDVATAGTEDVVTMEAVDTTTDEAKEDSNCL